MERQFVKSECPPADHSTNGFDVTSHPPNRCDSARDREPNPNSTRGQQMDSPRSNIQRTSSQKLSKAGIENIAKQNTDVKREIKEEEPDDDFNTDVRGENPILCPQVNELDVNPLVPNISEGTEAVVASPQLFRPINDPLKIIANRNWLSAGRFPSGVKEFRSKMQFKPEEEMPRLERMDDIDLMRRISIDATTSAENNGSFNFPADSTVAENFDNAPSAWELDSAAQDDQIDRNLDDNDSEANDLNQLFLGTNEEQPSEMPVSNKEQSAEPDKFACLDCPAVFETKIKFENHISTHDGYRRYQCSFCEKRFKRRANLAIHERIHSGEKPFKCPTCGESFIAKYKCVEHQRKHTGDLPFTCEDCEKSFATKNSYSYHRKTHAGDKMHSCGFCGWKFITSSKLRNHLRTHTGIKPYRCLICKTRYFSTSENWKRHVEKYHKEEYEACAAAGRKKRKPTKKPYKCAACDGTFKCPSDLSRHERIHSGEKLYECNFCYRGFFRQDNFNNHLLTHSDSKPYLCIVCKITFSTRDELVSHKQQSHRNGSETGNMSQIATTVAVPNK